MKTYIALLRGINVGGHRSLKMSELINSMLSLGFEKVNTLIQSGNVIFCSAISDNNQLERMIENKIKLEYGFDVPVIIKSLPELKNIIENNPFETETPEAIKQLYITFLKTPPTMELFDKFSAIAFAPDKFLVRNDVVYGLIFQSYAHTKFNNSFIEKKLNILATTRNWNTILKLAVMNNLPL